MKIKSITIELIKDNNDLQDHATIITFKDSMWSANGPMYSRITAALHIVWKTLKSMILTSTDHPNDKT